jgi:hypothetical protein
MSRRTAGTLGAVLLLVVIPLQHLLMGPAVVALSAGFVVSWCVWLARYDTLDRLDHRRVRVLYLAAIAVQVLHLLEEYLGGFQRAFPGFFGYELTDRQFLAFNLAALAVFVLGAVGLVLELRLAFLLVWIVALVAGLLNGAAHLAITLGRLAYFPGTITAPLALVLGALLVRELVRPRPSPA